MFLEALRSWELEKGIKRKLLMFSLRNNSSYVFEDVERGLGVMKGLNYSQSTI